MVGAMYLRIERPLTEAEREQLEGRLRRANEQTTAAAFAVVLLSLLDGVAVLAGVMILLTFGEDRSDTLGTIAGVMVLVIANFGLLLSAAVWADARRARRQVREALAGGTAVVEQVEATAVAWVAGGRFPDWFLLDVGEGRLLAVPDGLGLYDPREFRPVGDRSPGRRLPACFERVFTRAPRLHLATTARGLASLPLPQPINPAAVAPDARDYRELAAWLDTSPLFPGRLEDVRENLSLLLSLARAAADQQAERLAVAPEQRSSFDHWGFLQARIEERFGIDFGPGRLAAELARATEGGSGRLTAGELLGVIRRRLPGGASFIARPARPAFLRLRDALVAECGAPRHLIRPSARLEDLVPRAKRADHWTRLSRRLGQPLPPFAEGNPPAAVWVVTILGAGLVYAVGVPTVQAIDAWAAAEGFAGTWWYGGLGCCLVPTSFIGGIVLSAALSAHLFRNRFPLKFQAAYATVGQLARFLAQAAGAEGTAVPWTDEDVWLGLRAVLAEAAGRLPSEVTEDTDLSAALALRLPREGGAGPPR
jgi:hypothetical protein